MSQLLDFDVRDVVLSDGSFGPNEVNQILHTISQDPSRLAVLRDAVAELDGREDHTPASSVRLGVCQYLLGRYTSGDRQSVARRRRCAGAFLHGPGPSEPERITTPRCPASNRPNVPVTIRARATWRSPSPNDLRASWRRR